MNNVRADVKVFLHTPDNEGCRIRLRLPVILDKWRRAESSKTYVSADDCLFFLEHVRIFRIIFDVGLFLPILKSQSVDLLLGEMVTFEGGFHDQFATLFQLLKASFFHPQSLLSLERFPGIFLCLALLPFHVCLTLDFGLALLVIAAV